LSALLNFSAEYETIEGPEFVYYIGYDATLNEYDVVPSSDLKDVMKPEYSIFSEATEYGTSILNQSLSTCIDNNITEIIFEVKPKVPRVFNVKTYWKLVSKASRSISAYPQLQP
jgi:hypothetical protein